MFKYLITFIAVTVADLAMTLWFLAEGIEESNPVGESLYRHFGAPGLIALKVLTTSIVYGCCVVINRQKPIIARRVLIIGILLVASGPLASVRALTWDGEPMTQEEVNAYKAQQQAEAHARFLQRQKTKKVIRKKS